jgi:hypothetical protein
VVLRIPFCVIGFRNGGPALRMTLVRMYWKQENKNREVFSELTMLLFSRSSCGGMNLYRLSECLFMRILGATDHGCIWTVLKTASCARTTREICPSKGVKTLRETRSAVGRFRESVGAGSAQPTITGLAGILSVAEDHLLKIAIGMISARSMKRNLIC